MSNMQCSFKDHMTPDECTVFSAYAELSKNGSQTVQSDDPALIEKCEGLSGTTIQQIADGLETRGWLKTIYRLPVVAKLPLSKLSKNKRVAVEEKLLLTCIASLEDINAKVIQAGPEGAVELFGADEEMLHLIMLIPKSYFGRYTGHKERMRYLTLLSIGANTQPSGITSPLNIETIAERATGSVNRAEETVKWLIKNNLLKRASDNTWKVLLPDMVILRKEAEARQHLLDSSEPTEETVSINVSKPFALSEKGNLEDQR